MREFIEAAKQKLGIQRIERKSGYQVGMGMGTLPRAGASGGAGSSGSLNRHHDRKGSLSTLDSDSPRGSDTDIAGRLKFDQVQ